MIRAMAKADSSGRRERGSNMGLSNPNWQRPPLASIELDVV